MTFLAALRHDRIDAPWFIEGPIVWMASLLPLRSIPMLNLLQLLQAAAHPTSGGIGVSGKLVFQSVTPTSPI